MIDHVEKRIQFRYNDPIAYCNIIYTGVKLELLFLNYYSMISRHPD